MRRVTRDKTVPLSERCNVGGAAAEVEGGELQRRFMKLGGYVPNA